MHSSQKQQYNHGGLLFSYYELLNAEAAIIVAPLSTAAAARHATARDKYHRKLTRADNDTVRLHVDMVRALNAVRSSGRFPVLSDEVMRRGDRMNKEPRR
jgi:hypothetical protein